MNRGFATALSLSPLVLVTIAAAVLLTSHPSAPAAVPIDETQLHSAQTEAPAASTLLLPETRGAPPYEAPHALSVAGLRVVLPRLGIDLPLDLGDAARDVPRPDFAGATPEYLALVYPGSRGPGEGGNTYIYAHARAGMFLSLWNARVGDTVVIARVDGSIAHSYRVVLIAPRVDPTDTHWLDAGGDERITLQTSTGARPEDPRFIVVAYPTSEAPEAPRLP